MDKTNDSLDLSGKLLLAMPGMGDPRFDHSVVFMCSHSEDGAMGLIINKPTEDLELSDLLQQLDIDPDPDLGQIQIHFGGPVEHGRGFVLHSSEYRENEATLNVGTEFSMTSTPDILEDINQGAGPVKSILALGYAGWGPGQLEGEIARNGWLTCDADAEIVFGCEDGDKWQAALASMGIDPLLLSAQGGRA